MNTESRSLLNEEELLKNRTDKHFLNHYRQRHFTHIYAATGSFLSENPSYSFELYDDERTRFDYASLTKALVTAPLVFWDLEQRKLPPQTPVKDWCFGSKKIFSDHLSQVPVSNLLSHTSGLPDWRSLWISCANEKRPDSERQHVIERINYLRIDPLQSGQYVYSDIGYIILGLCLEEIYKTSLGELFENFCEKILDYSDSDLTFNLTRFEREQSISTGFCHVRQTDLLGLVHDENAGMLLGHSGHAGLFGSGPGLVSYLRRLLFSPIGKKFLHENIKMRKDRKNMIGLMGFHQGGGESSHPFGDGNAVGHLGFTGTAFWIIPEDNLYSLLLTNRVITGRLSPWNTQFRKESFSLFYEILNCE